MRSHGLQPRPMGYRTGPGPRSLIFFCSGKRKWWAVQRYRWLQLRSPAPRGSDAQPASTRTLRWARSCCLWPTVLGVWADPGSAAEGSAPAPAHPAIQDSETGFHNARRLLCPWRLPTQSGGSEQGYQAGLGECPRKQVTRPGPGGIY
jgi:hypothetical protein